ncbi:MAG: dUTP diphosphatase [Acidobacteriota bacterium]
MSGDPGQEPVLRIQRLPSAEGLSLPAPATEAAAGLDVVAAVEEPLELAPGTRAAVPTGLRVALPQDTELQVRPRSGLAFRDGVTVLNGPGTIDADYRGEVKVLLVNLGDATVRIERGERIAQLVLAPVLRPRCVEVDVLDETTRGEGGFGSTGRR